MGSFLRHGKGVRGDCRENRADQMSAGWAVARVHPQLGLRRHCGYSAPAGAAGLEEMDGQDCAWLGFAR